MVRAKGRPRIRFADPHRLRPPAGGLASSLKRLRVFFTLAPSQVQVLSPAPLIERAPSNGSFFVMGRFGRFDISISRGRCPCGQKVANMSTDMKIETFHEAIFAHFAQQMYANLAQP